MLDWLLNLDKELLLLLNGQQNYFWDYLMRLISEKEMWYVFYIVLMTCVINTFGWKKGGLIILSLILVIAISDQIASGIFKPLFKRFRPSRDPDFSHLVNLVKGYTGGKYGFVSSHAANSFGLAVLASLILKDRITGAFLIFWAVLVSYSRIYLGVHYPSDIIGGAIVGISMAYLSYFLLRKYFKSSLLKKPVEQTHPIARLYQISLLGTLQIIIMAFSVYFCFNR
ncbi:phosphatase PAP2 family protein [Labilibaculum antarcticum]|uniref:Phospholipid phosphatase n=1 Tax=Labilibaculum antarcticum TaxID=1717717 RepID=A0A1Y1CF37_9BACT|nr:phosphatase PAP2 family protein [Labilibaculum antarcticum]BAX78934.1 phospholipid phosphatase [Labilibaculum antarcticum]